jgi:hypothetical protein
MMSGKKGGGRAGGRGGSVSAETLTDIAGRYLRITGEMIPSGRPEGLAVGGKFMNIAQILFRTSGVLAELPIGMYDPARSRWSFAPEYVRPVESSVLERQMKKEAESAVAAWHAAAVDVGRTVADLYHPYTQKVRAELAGLMRPLLQAGFLGRPAAREAMESSASPVVGTDSHTIVYPCLADRFTAVENVERVGIDDSVTTTDVAKLEADAFVLVATGVKVENMVAPGHTRREVRGVTLANRDRDTGLFIPNPDVVTPDDWDVLSNVRDRLAHAHVENPDFSLIHCAVTYGKPYDLGSVVPTPRAT